MALKQMFEDSSFSTPSRVIDTYHFHHAKTGRNFRLEIAEDANERYTAFLYEEQVEDEEGRNILARMEIPWVDEKTAGGAFDLALNFLEARL